MFAASLDPLSRFGAHRAAIPHKNWLRRKVIGCSSAHQQVRACGDAITAADRKNGLTCRDFRKTCRHLGSEY
jgi:hypothetical protein